MRYFGTAGKGEELLLGYFKIVTAFRFGIKVVAGSLVGEKQTAFQSIYIISNSMPLWRQREGGS